MRKATPHIPSHMLQERWFLVDANEQTLGRLATKIAKLLMGKDLPSYNPAVDAKTAVVVTNADKVKLTGTKTTNKVYYRHTGYLGGLRATTPEKIFGGNNPERVLESAVYGMLPKNKLRHVMMKRLKLYTGTEHPHAGQNPVVIN